ncbi:MAG: DUF4167 domain-containing protein [Alphaproteobacteria bacterium]|nr:DUF4167 domain-containing protein [Alphaproteobacteria bacterium]
MDNMRRGNNSKRSRNGRPNGRGKPPMMNRSLESNTPDGNKVRGNANQLYERYTSLAREAQSAGDRVAAEGFLQYAEHYYRVLSAAGWKRNGNGQQQPQQGNGQGRPPNGQGEHAPQDGMKNANQPQMGQKPADPQAAYADSEDETAELGPVN